MIYQVRVNMYFANEGIARGLYTHAQELFPQATVININEENTEWSSIELIGNNHDTDPAAPCTLLTSHFDKP